MSAELTTFCGMKRPMKTFEASFPVFDLLGRTSALLSFAKGKNVPEREIITRAILAHVATDALAEAPGLLAERLGQIAADEQLTAEQRATQTAEVRAHYDALRAELLAACERHGVSVEVPKGKGKR